MLEIIFGAAGTGKTARVMAEICRAVAQKRPGQLLLVPEQYSHEAERELCRVCGDTLSLYGEVLSFTRLAYRVDAELGGVPRKTLDAGGKLLVLNLALGEVGSRLRLYGAARRQPELQRTLLSAMDELAAGCVSPEAMLTAAEKAEGSLSDKLHDLALLSAACDAICANGSADPAHRLDPLAENIARSHFAAGHIYIDGFTDFTRQEEAVVEALLKADTDVTVCLTLDTLYDGSELFDASRRTALRLISMAKPYGGARCTPVAAAEQTLFQWLGERLFTYTADRFSGDASSVRLRCAPDMTSECRAAAFEIRRLLQGGARARDIAVAVRGFEDYAPTLERVFAQYDIPLYVARRSDILRKSVCALIVSAFAALDRWEYEDVFSCLKTGLMGLNAGECDILENYVLLWSLRGNAWAKNEDWRSHPAGYGAKFTEETEAELTRVNALRKRASAPLLRYAAARENASTATEQAMALAAFLEDIGLAQQLENRAAELQRAGFAAQAAETVQVWDIVVSSLEQFAAVLGQREMDGELFARLFPLVLGSHDIGTIPVALDRVTAGDMDRMRRRHIKHLFILGASDDRLPRISGGAGVFSDEDRETLETLSINLGGTGEDTLLREMNLIYNCFTLAKESLYLSYCAADGDGAELRSAYAAARVSSLLELPFLPTNPRKDALGAKTPAFSLAAAAHRRPGDALCRAVNGHFLADAGRKERLAALEKAAKLRRGNLSRASVEALYGKNLRLSSSRIDLFSSCRFAYFMQYGLKAKPREPAGFDPPEFGSFMHYVLEHAAADISAMGGFAGVTGEQVEAITDKYVRQYVHDELNDFREKSARFVYLFRRLTVTVRRVVADMAAELAKSDFVPLDFELDFSGRGDMEPVTLACGDGSEIRVTGVADRVDGWKHDSKLYLRIADYKTGKKTFSLSDVWYGMGMQMLLYLFSLQKHGEQRYGCEVVPAGVSYIPARDVLVSARGNISDEEILNERSKKLRRSGLFLDNAAVLNALEHGESVYLPITYGKDGKRSAKSAESLATLEQFGALAKRIDDTLIALAKELQRGSIAADPYYRGKQENACLYCDYFNACHFDESCDRRRYLTRYSNLEILEKLKEGENGRV